MNDFNENSIGDVTAQIVNENIREWVGTIKGPVRFEKIFFRKAHPMKMAYLLLTSKFLLTIHIVHL